MYFMNSFEIETRARQFRDHPVLGPATQTLHNLMDWTDSHSDGWAYWPKPVRAAARLMRLIDMCAQQERSHLAKLGPDGHLIVDPAEYRKALVPIRAFKTRHGADFEIVTMAQLSLFGRNY